MTMLDEKEILDNLDIAFDSMSPKELFETWRNITDTLDGDFPVVYSKSEFDELIERMPEEELVKLVEKSADFKENAFYFSIYDGQLYSKTYLDTYFTPIWQTCDKAYDMLTEKRLTLGSKRLEEAFTEDFDKNMHSLYSDLLRFFEKNEKNEKNEWKKYVEGCKKVGYDGMYGPIPMEDRDYFIDEERDYFLGYISDSFNFQDDWFYFNKEKRQFFSFTDWDYDIGNRIGIYEYHEKLMDYIIRTGDDLYFTGVREILDKNKKYGYVPRKDGNLYYY